MIPIKGQSENDELEDLRRKVREQEVLIEAQRYEIEQRARQERTLRDRLVSMEQASMGHYPAMQRLKDRFSELEEQLREQLRVERTQHDLAVKNYRELLDIELDRRDEVAELLGVGVDELLPTLRATKQSRDRMVASRLGRMMLRLARARYG